MVNGPGGPAMFFAGLILLIPHRIGMSRVNYIIKRYHLPISRAGLLLYKFHNPIEVSLFIGNVLGVCISIPAAMVGNATANDPANYRRLWVNGGFMLFFLSLMLLSSIFMFIIYIIGSDYGHLNSFYFSLILITFFDGINNAFAFAINGINASLLAAGIPISGFLISILHYIYKFFSDSFHWDDFDYYVLRLQLFLNILTIFITIGLWSWDLVENQSGAELKPVAPIKELFNLGDNAHIYDWFPICMLAISLGTVYAFYPSIAPYSIIDYQYASVIELWILIISAILPFVIAILDTDYGNKNGPSGNEGSLSLSISSGSISATGNLDYTGQTIELTNIQVTHTQKHNSPTGTVVEHPPGTECPKEVSHDNGSTGDPQFHDYHPTDSSKNNLTYNIVAGDKYYDNNKATAIPVNDPLNSSTPTSITISKYYQNWFQYNNPNISGINIGSASQAVKYNKVPFTITGASVTRPASPTGHRWWWNLVWICAIFYILCIQIFMTMLHYPDCLLSCFFKDHPYAVVFISVLFNTLRELMQACGFAGAGKQCSNLNTSSFKSEITFSDLDDYDVSGVDNIKNNSSGTLTAAGQLKLPSLFTPTGGLTYKVGPSGTAKPFSNIQATASTSFKIPKAEFKLGLHVNSTITATNKLITLFVMMFCVFTGDGYLQHYRSCCRDCWPTTGYSRYKSFRYWLRCDFKGGSKSFTTSFTSPVKTQNIITNIVINLFVAEIVPLGNRFGVSIKKSSEPAINDGILIVSDDVACIVSKSAAPVIVS